MKVIGKNKNRKLQNGIGDERKEVTWQNTRVRNGKSDVSV
jgi:hypothetical protein